MLKHIIMQAKTCFEISSDLNIWLNTSHDTSVLWDLLDNMQANYKIVCNGGAEQKDGIGGLYEAIPAYVVHKG